MNDKPDWLKALYPWPQSTLTVNGRRMAFVDEGPKGARPVLLLHGNPTWGFLYRDFVEPLKAAGYRVIVPDCIGAGYSDKPRIDAAYSLAHHIADLVSLIDQLDLTGFAVVGQDWGGPQGTGAALMRLERLSALTLMNTWLFTDYKGRFHTGARPWTTWHAPLIGPYVMKRLKILSAGGPSRTSQRGLSEAEARAYHHVYDERESETVTLTWPRSIPLEEGDRGWADMAWIQAGLPRLAGTPIQLLWAPEDQVFPIEYAHRLKELLPHAEDIKTFDKAAHFLQDDRGPDLAAEVVGFLKSQRGNEGMNFVTPTTSELAALRADPLVFEQELDVRPDVAASLERALGFRAGRAYWRAASGQLYAVELGDFGRGRPSMAILYGFWPRYEPRPLTDEQIDDDLEAFLIWMAQVSDGLDPADLQWTLERTPRHRDRAR